MRNTQHRGYRGRLARTVTFHFPVGHRFEGPEVDIVVERLSPADPDKGWLPAYVLKVVLKGQQIGSLSVRLGYSDSLVRYGGHLGYGIDTEFRGNRYASKACELTRSIFQSHGMDVVWITCNPENIASTRTCEFLGAEYVQTVDLPPSSDMYQKGERRKKRFRWIVFSGDLC